MTAMAAWLHWLARSSCERRRQHQRRVPFDPRQRPAADRRQALPGNPAGQRRQRAGQRRLVVRRASGGQSAGPRRLAVPDSPARPFGVSEPAAARSATDRLSRLDRHDHRDRRYRCAAGRGRHERAACTVRAGAAAVSVRRRRTMTNQAGLLPAATVARTV